MLCAQQPCDDGGLRASSAPSSAYLLQHVHVGAADADSSHSYADIIARKINSERQVFDSQVINSVNQRSRVRPAFRDLCTNASFEKCIPQLRHWLSSGEHDSIRQDLQRSYSLLGRGRSAPCNVSFEQRLRPVSHRDRNRKSSGKPQWVPKSDGVKFGNHAHSYRQTAEGVQSRHLLARTSAASPIETRCLKGLLQYLFIVRVSCVGSSLCAKDTMALRAVSRIGSLKQLAPQVSMVASRGFANFDERERGEEVQMRQNLAR